ncbi:unnamed protein product [Amoebophrya sp. A120]|nr:unnamed protein product [Amoebophrya sp. A120]|eukprot:GSA120T00016291001.1
MSARHCDWYGFANELIADNDAEVCLIDHRGVGFSVDEDEEMLPPAGHMSAGSEQSRSPSSSSSSSRGGKNENKPPSTTFFSTARELVSRDFWSNSSMEAYAEDVLDVILHGCKWTKFHLMGLSLGGMIAQKLALRIANMDNISDQNSKSPRSTRTVHNLEIESLSLITTSGELHFGFSARGLAPLFYNMFRMTAARTSEKAGRGEKKKKKKQAIAPAVPQQSESATVAGVAPCPKRTTVGVATRRSGDATADDQTKNLPQMPPARELLSEKARKSWETALQYLKLLYSEEYLEQRAEFSLEELREQFEERHTPFVVPPQQEELSSKMSSTAASHDATADVETGQHLRDQRQDHSEQDPSITTLFEKFVQILLYLMKKNLKEVVADVADGNKDDSTEPAHSYPSGSDTESGDNSGAEDDHGKNSMSSTTHAEQRHEKLRKTRFSWSSTITTLAWLMARSRVVDEEEILDFAANHSRNLTQRLESVANKLPFEKKKQEDHDEINPSTSRKSHYLTTVIVPSTAFKIVLKQMKAGLFFSKLTAEESRKIRSKVKKISVIGASLDKILPEHASQALAVDLEADLFVRFENSGHMLFDEHRLVCTTVLKECVLMKTGTIEPSTSSFVKPVEVRVLRPKRGPAFAYNSTAPSTSTSRLLREALLKKPSPDHETSAIQQVNTKIDSGAPSVPCEVVEIDTGKTGFALFDLESAKLVVSTRGSHQKNVVGSMKNSAWRWSTDGKAKL